MAQRIFSLSGVEKSNGLPMAFENNEHVMRIIERIVAPLGRRIDESSPYVDARLPWMVPVLMRSFHQFLL